MDKVTIACVYWGPNSKTRVCAKGYTEEYVDRLYAGCKDHITVPFRFVCLVDKARPFNSEITQIPLEREPGYGSGVECYRLDGPLIVMGIDTVIRKNIDHLASYRGDDLLLTKPKRAKLPTNGVALVPAGFTHMWDDYSTNKAHDTQNRDMIYVRQFCGGLINEHWPDSTANYKFDDWKDAAIVTFSGAPKPHEVQWLE